MNNTFSHKFEKIVFYILSSIIVVYIAVEVIELVYQFGKALLTKNENSRRLLITKEQTAMVLPVFFLTY
jgi:hypothetical protein